MDKHLGREHRLMLGFLAALLLSCGPALTATPRLAPTVMHKPTAEPMPAPTLAPTRRPTSAPRATAAPPLTPTPESIGPFIPASLAGRPPGDILDWRAAPDGTLWLVTSEGVGSLQNGKWTLHPNQGQIILGFDEAGRTWLASDDGNGIAAWDGAAWTSYNAQSGWTPAGPVRRDGLYPTVSDKMVTDARGRVWLVTPKDVRVFDGKKWSVYAPEAVGFTPSAAMVEEGLDFWLTEIALDSAGDIWVGDCLWMGPGPKGQGARWFNGKTWQGQDSPVVAAGCIRDIEVDAAGRIWVGVDGVLWRYTPGAGWTKFVPPEPDAGIGRRWGQMTDITLGGDETVWVTLAPCGGASCEEEVFSLFRLRGDVWRAVRVEGLRDLALDSHGEGWLCTMDGLYHVVGETVEPVLKQERVACAVESDSAGRVWLSLPGRATLWWYDAKN